MDEIKNALPAAGPDQCAQNPTKNYEIDRRDRLILAGAAAFCFLLVDTVLFHQPGAGVTALTAVWYALTRACGGRGLSRGRESRVLAAAVLALGLSFALTSNWYFRLWNLGALALLAPVQALAEAGTLPWYRPAMLKERLGLLARGLFGSLGAAPAALRRGGGRRSGALALGAVAAAALVAVLGGLLASADALFASVVTSALDLSGADVAETLWKAALAAVCTPFVFGLLYRLRRPEAGRPQPGEGRAAAADGAFFAVVLGALCGLYLLFIAVQVSGLLGGAAYLEAQGLSYAEWARSGFFQMVGVTAVNLAVMLSALCRSRRDGRGWGAVRGLAALLTAESFVLLGSACWRMSLYVSTYGLSFKRCMTYWGMAMMAVFFAVALGKVLRPERSFWRVAAPLALAGWLALNCVPLDALVARDNTARYLAGRASVDLYYLAYRLDYDALEPLERLRGTPAEEAFQKAYGCSLEAAVEERREQAAAECAQWESWNLSAWLAAGGGSR